MIESKAAADRLRGGFFVADAQTASSSPIAQRRLYETLIETTNS